MSRSKEEGGLLDGMKEEEAASELRDAFLTARAAVEDPRDATIRTLAKEVERLADILHGTRGSGWNDLSSHAVAARGLLRRMGLV